MSAAPPAATPLAPVAAAPLSVKSPDSSPLSGRMLGPNGDSETLRPAEVDPSMGFPRRRSGSKVIAPLVIAAALIVTSVWWIRLSADAGDTAAAPVEPAMKRPAAEAIATNELAKPAEPVAPKTPPPAPSPAEAPRNASAEAASEKPASPELSDASAAALNKGESSVVVSVRTVPPAIIFEAGKRIGAGTIEVNVEPARKLRLTALLDGHAPQNFTLDGSKPAVTIMMKPVGKNTASFPPTGGHKPAGSANQPASGKTAPSPPTAEFGEPRHEVAR